MKKLNIDLANCYGIKELHTQFDFSRDTAYGIYAPNGVMKSSLARTFKDIQDGAQSKDIIFQSRVCSRNVTDETGAPLSKDNVLVVPPYDEVFGHTEKTSTLLVNATLRTEYEKLSVDSDNAKELFLRALKELSGSKKDIEKEISSTFTKGDDKFYAALVRVKDEVTAQKEAPYAHIRYDSIFDDKVIAFLGTKDFKTAIEEYVRKYNELLAASTYFKKGTFNYYNATTIAKILADNGFFAAKHFVTLNANEKLEITTQKELEDLINAEKDRITEDIDLRKKFAEIDKLINKNLDLRNFEAYLTEHEEILPLLSNVDSLKEEIFKSYFKAKFELYNDLIQKYQSAERRKQEIEEEASKERTQWESVIAIFNSRFFVPFKLTAQNRTSVILGEEPMLRLGFTFEDGGEKASVEKTTLMQVLSTGEKKALYILNIIFEVEARKKAQTETLFVVDDIADSFDYKNKYAIVQYLKDIEEEPYFKQIILTHNFDFFRTLNSRFVPYHHCLMAFKDSTGLSLRKAEGIKNIFVNDWKPAFFTDPKKRIASIPFMRNIVEYTKGEVAPEFATLTSLLHRKINSASITEADLDAIYNSLFGAEGHAADPARSVIDVICDEAKKCLTADVGANFENKIVLSIAIRLHAEKFMIGKINNPTFAEKIDSKQTSMLFKEFKRHFTSEVLAIDTLQRVLLMTPENIHLNSFMYEPILDMSDEHLRKLHDDVVALK